MLLSVNIDLCLIVIFLLTLVPLFMKPLFFSSLPLKLLLVMFFASLVACSVGPVEELDDPSAPKGPGIFTGPTGEFLVTDFFDADKKRRASGGYYILDLDGAPPMTEEQFKEFESFRAWLRSREEGTEEHKEYESWRAFQQYRSLQAK
ncbi:MAG: hypothetical protein ACI9D5_001626 [Candidatus Endobugula sp.]|jgi:hypothetical protein